MILESADESHQGNVARARLGTAVGIDINGVCVVAYGGDVDVVCVAAVSIDAVRVIALRIGYAVAVLRQVKPRLARRRALLILVGRWRRNRVVMRVSPIGIYRAAVIVVSLRVRAGGVRVTARIGRRRTVRVREVLPGLVCANSAIHVDTAPIV